MKIKKFESFKEQMQKILIFYSLIPIIIISILGCGIVYFFNYRGIIRKNQVKLEEISQKIDEVFEFSKDRIDFISNSSIIRDAILNKRKSKILYEVLYGNKIRKKISGDIFLYDKDFNILANSGEKIESNSWGIFYRMEKNPTKVVEYVGRTYFNNREKSNYSIGKAVTYQGKNIGYIVYYFLENGIKKVIGDSNGMGVIITDEYGNIIFSSVSRFRNSVGRIDKKVLLSNGYFQYEKKKYYIKNIKRNGINVYVISYIDYLVLAFKESLWYLIVVFFVLLFFMSKIAKKIAVEKTKALSEIVRAIKKIESGNLDYKVNITSRDEFEIIGNSYNEMLENIKILIERNKEEVRHSVISEIKQLESQFNPHFLFNSLEMLRYSIYLDKKKANKIILNMASILRYSIENIESEVQLQKEIFYVKNYLELQKLRLGDRFKYFFKFDDRLVNKIVPKLIIQPIVENSIKYGYTQDRDFYVVIAIKKRGENLQVDIYDNGIGMEKEKIRKLRENLNKKYIGRGLGLYSVQRRISLLYGGKYGLKIYSSRRGSYIKILIPLQEGKDNDKSIDC